jgi:hypothetical protein
MDTGDVVASTIAIVSLIATAFLAYRRSQPRCGQGIGSHSRY